MQQMMRHGFFCIPVKIDKRKKQQYTRLCWCIWHEKVNKGDGTDPTRGRESAVFCKETEIQKDYPIIHPELH